MMASTRRCVRKQYSHMVMSRVHAGAVPVAAVVAGTRRPTIAQRVLDDERQPRGRSGDVRHHKSRGVTTIIRPMDIELGRPRTSNLC